ncbi:hypothetical protein ACI2LF_08375 [Kribbella sp. NPDC020789]
MLKLFRGKDFEFTVTDASDTRMPRAPSSYVAKVPERRVKPCLI